MRSRDKISGRFTPQRPQLSIPRGYPHQLSDEKITSTIDDIQTFIEKRGFNINDLIRFAPVLQAGANELQSRNVDRQAQISREYADTSKRLSLISVVIAVVALLVAVSTSVLSFRAAQQDTLIQKQQLEALKTLPVEPSVPDCWHYRPLQDRTTPR